MTTIIQPLFRILPSPVNLSTLLLGTFPTAGVTSDFGWGIFIGLGLIAFFLCVLNIVFLRGHEISRSQLTSNRRFQLLRQNRLIAEYQFKPWQRILGNLTFKIGIPLVCYSLASGKNASTVWTGLLSSICFLYTNARLMMRALLHPRSLYHRRFLFFRIDPTFIRVRLFFELTRRFGYFVLGLTLISYCLHRIYGNNALFALNTNGVSLFLCHLQSTLTGMTSLGNDPLSYANDYGIAFEVFRTSFAFLLVLSFANIILSGLASSGSDAAGKALAYPGIRETVDHGVQTRNDLAALVELIIESRLQVSSIQIKPEADLVRDLGADSLDLVELHVELENLVECSLIQPDRIAQKRTVGEIIDFLWEHLQQDANPLSERVFRPATCAQTVQIKKRLVREETPPTSI